MDNDKRKTELLELALKIQEANPLLVDAWFATLGKEDRALFVSALMDWLAKAKESLADAIGAFNSIIPEEASL